MLRLFKKITPPLRDYRIYLQSGEVITVLNVRIEMRDGFFECIGKWGLHKAFYRCDIVRGIDSNPA